MVILPQNDLKDYLREQFNDPLFEVNGREGFDKFIEIPLRGSVLVFQQTYKIFPECFELNNTPHVTAQYIDAGQPNFISKVYDCFTLAILNDRISKLQEQQPGIDPVVIASLQNLLASLCVHKHRSVNQIITNHFIRLVDALYVKPHMKVKEITRSFEALDKKLYGSKPSVKVIAAITGVIGALIGGAVGIFFGALMTIPQGGYGALPGAIWGAIKGYTFATAMGIQLGIISGIFSGVYGTFKGNNELLKYSIFKNSVQKDQVGMDVVENVLLVKQNLLSKVAPKK